MATKTRAVESTLDDPSAISVEQQLALLIATLRNHEGQPYRPPEISRATGITVQALHNLLHGHVHNPRLYTLKQVCNFYSISLDYFDCKTEEQCQSYLAQKRLKEAPAVVHEIAQLSSTLSAKGQRNVLTMMEWIEMGDNTSR